MLDLNQPNIDRPHRLLWDQEPTLMPWNLTNYQPRNIVKDELLVYVSNAGKRDLPGIARGTMK